MTIYSCGECESEFNSLNQLKYHKYKEHVDAVCVGESNIIVKKTEKGFHCPNCDALYSTPNGFRKHLNGHQLPMSIPSKRTFANISENDEPDSNLHSLHNLDDSKTSDKKNNELDYNSTILAACDALVDIEEIKQDKLAIAKLGCWKPITLSVHDCQYHFLSSSTTVKAVMEDKASGTWQTPANLSELSLNSAQVDGPSRLKSLFFKSQVFLFFVYCCACDAG
ncbi:hypothetical protein RMATCC62417_14564 [Rhizopus microsporus]|nr:hypothetical protein RMATCC62417_14564 [Rhizopus microsporus]